MHYYLLIQGSPSNCTLEWINPYKYRNPYFTYITVLLTPNQVMFNNVDSTNVVTKSNDEELTIPPGYYTIGQIIAILNTMTDTMFSISTKASSYGCIYIQSTRFHQCSGYSRNPRFIRSNGYSTRFVLWIERDLYHSKSSSDPSVLVPRAFLRSEDCQPEQQSAQYNDH